MKSGVLGILLWIIPTISIAVNPDKYNRETGEPIDGIRIAWDYNSIQQLAPTEGRVLSYAGYPRIRRLQNGTLMAVYQTEKDGEMIQSKNNGKTWSDPVSIIKSHRYTNSKGESVDINIANTELLQLQNGDLIFACNYRPVKGEIAPYAIVVKRSLDLGKTWLDEQIVYEACPRFKDGCWEPSMLQLPNGELQIYFANEAPYTNSNEQEISMITSSDNGKTWSKEIKTVSFRASKRDGMPVALLAGDEILVSIEDNKVGEFKPYIIRNRISDNWKYPVLTASRSREYALKDSLPEKIYAGAPYIMRLSSGEIILSYQTTKGRTSDWELSTMEVAVGDDKGRSFDKITQPFQIFPDKQAKWNSISLWDERTIVAASSTDMYTKNVSVLMILGHIIPELKTSEGIIPVQDDNYQIFIGHKGKTNLKASLCSDKDNLYVSIKVDDKYLFARTGNVFNKDGVFLYIDAGNYNLLNPDSGLYKIWGNHLGKSVVFEGSEGEWKERKKTKIKVKRSVEKDGYRLLYTIPLSAIGKNDYSPIRINLELQDYDVDRKKYVECVTNSTPTSSNTWVKVLLDSNFMKN